MILTRTRQDIYKILQIHFGSGWSGLGALNRDALMILCTKNCSYVNMLDKMSHFDDLYRISAGSL